MILPSVDPGGTYGYAAGIETWCLGANDEFGTCGFAGIGNGHAIVTKVATGTEQIMSDGEIELMYRDVAGFMPTDRTTDHGAALKAILDYWAIHGWAGDPTLVPVDRQQIAFDQIADTVDAMGWAYCWFMLPERDDDPDLSDDAVKSGRPGVGAHCMTVIGAAPGQFEVVTWGKRRIVSSVWMQAYWRGGYAVQHPLWVRPA